MSEVTKKNNLWITVEEELRKRFVILRGDICRNLMINRKCEKDSCKYIHDTSICFHHWKFEKCKYGDECKKKHVNYTSKYDKNKVNVENMIKDIIKSIIGETTITEFTMTGETSGEIFSSKQPQPPSTFAYGAYKNLKTAITDKNIKLTLKIHNPTQAFKITHLINVPQTYSNCYAQKEPNYEKI